MPLARIEDGCLVGAEDEFFTVDLHGALAFEDVKRLETAVLVRGMGSFPCIHLRNVQAQILLAQIGVVEITGDTFDSEFVEDHENSWGIYD